jgi:enamine deaminase RidA (YjgF/YER057c/UK114 family)
MANRRSGVSAILSLFAAVLCAQRPPAPILTEQDKNNQTLNLPKDPPLVAVGETARLTFQVSPLTGNGLLSQQTRDALKAILKLNGGSQIVHIRAFSAGNGDIRRIPQIVSDVLADKHGPLPSVSVLQAGALTLRDAQVVLETVSLGRKQVNEGGLTFYAAETAVADTPAATVRTLLQKAADELAARMNGKPALSVTCFTSTLDEGQELVRIVTSRFPGAATNLVQPRRLAWQTEADCEGVARGGGLTSPGIAFTGTQIAFGSEGKDAVLAFQHLDRALAAAGAPRSGEAALLRLYLLSPGTVEVARKQIGGGVQVSPLPVEGVGPSSAGFAMDAVAPAR